MSFLLSSPGTTDFPDVLRKYPKRCSMLLHLTDDIMRGDSPFSVAERELLFAYVSSMNSCSFCFESHKPVAAAFGIDEEVFEELIHDINSASVSAVLKPVLHFVRKLALTPHKMVDADATAIYAAGWNEQAFVDAVSICAIASYYNRFVDGVGVDVSSEHARRTGASLLPTIGYAGLAEELEKAL